MQCSLTPFRLTVFRRLATLVCGHMLQRCRLTQQLDAALTCDVGWRLNGPGVLGGCGCVPYWYLVHAGIFSGAVAARTRTRRKNQAAAALALLSPLSSRMLLLAVLLLLLLLLLLRRCRCITAENLPLTAWVRRKSGKPGRRKRQQGRQQGLQQGRQQGRRTRTQSCARAGRRQWRRWWPRRIGACSLAKSSQTFSGRTRWLLLLLLLLGFRGMCLQCVGWTVILYVCALFSNDCHASRDRFASVVS